MARKSVAKEKAVVKRLRERLKKTVGGTWKKIHGDMFQSLMLDLVGCVKGNYIEIEVKRPGRLSHVTDQQQARIEEVLANGGLSFATDDVDTAVKRIKRWLRTRG